MTTKATFYTHEKTVLLVDGPHLNATCAKLGIRVDFKSLLQKFQHLGQLQSARYYTNIPVRDGNNPVIPLIEWMGYNGWQVTTKPMRENGERDSLTVEIALDAMKLSPAIDHLILASGNGIFTRLARDLQDAGTRVSLLASCKTEQQTIATALRSQVDGMIDLDDIRDEISFPADQQAA